LGLGSLDGWEKLFLAGLVFHQLVCLLQALSPPVAGEGLHYLFVLARSYSSAGEILYHPDIYASRPQNMVLLFSLVQLFGRAEASQLITWWIGLLSLGALIGLGRNFLDRRTALLAALILSAGPLWFMVAGRGMSDLGILFFSLAGLTSLLKVQDREASRHWPVLAGIFLGAAAGFKVIGLAALLTGLLMALGMTIRGRLSPANLALLIFLGLMTASPWYIYSQLHTGQLIYGGGRPDGLLSRADRTRLLGLSPEPKPVPAGDGAVAEKPRTNPPPGKTTPQKKAAGVSARNRAGVWALIRSSLNAPGHNPIPNLWDLNLMAGHRQRVVGPLILILCPLLLFLRPVPPGLRWALVAGLIHFLLCSILFGPYLRYTLPGLALLALGAAWAWQSLTRTGPWPRLLAVVLLAMGWGTLLPEAGYALSHNLPVAVGLQDRAVYLDKAFQGELAVYAYANQHLPSKAKVLLIAEYRPYYLERPFVYGSMGRNPYLRYDEFLSKGGREKIDPEADKIRMLEAVVRRFGITHLLINKRRSDNAWDLSGSNAANLAVWLSRLDRWTVERMERLFCQGELCLYRLKDLPPKATESRG
jgi:hypothetical protein